MAVATHPEQMLFTRMPSFLSSAASMRVRALSAAFETP